MVVWSYPTEIQCTYNPVSHSYAMADSYPQPVP
jgi:hypothetical protein